MTEIIGFWVICLAIIILIIGVAYDGDFKEKVKAVAFLVSFITLVTIGSVLMVGV